MKPQRVKLLATREELQKAQAEITRLKDVLGEIEDLLLDEKSEPSCPICDTYDRHLVLVAILNKAR